MTRLNPGLSSLALGGGERETVGTRLATGLKCKNPCSHAHKGMGDVAAVVRSSTVSPLNNRTNKRNKERGVKSIELLHIAVQ